MSIRSSSACVPTASGWAVGALLLLGIVVAVVMVARARSAEVDPADEADRRLANLDRRMRELEAAVSSRS